VSRFIERAGRPPATLWELATAEHLPGIPVDPDGNPYEVTPDGRVQIEKPDDFPFVTKGLPPGYKPSGPPKFHTKG
jgi:hypothetical protein